jgi:hypothetical protein
MNCAQCGSSLKEDWETGRRLCRRCQWATPDARKTLDAFRRTFGPYKKVVEAGSGVARAVPLETIVVEGIRGADLGKFELWDEAKHGGSQGV